MKYRSTRGEGESLSLSAAIEKGLADDGGLFMPEVLDHIDAKTLDPSLPLPEFAAAWMRDFAKGDDVLSREMDAICREAFDFPIPTKELAPNLSVLELFHGPTIAFKDVGARFLSSCIAHLSKGVKRTVLVATSGDTGGAVASAFVGKPGIDVIVLYPKRGVSARQEAQLTGWGENVRAFAVNGVFDDCQRIVKEAFASEKWRKAMRLVSANSINLGRLIPQSMYYARESIAHANRTGTAPTFYVPTGNLGNGLAALLAKRRGAPIEHVVLCCNANETLPEYFKTGSFAANPSVATLANAMDVGNPSNFERLRLLYPNRTDLLHEASANSVSDDQIRSTIRNVFERFGYISCPHTATAFALALEAKGERIVVATAHPAKFETIVEPIIGTDIAVPDALSSILEKKREVYDLGPSLEALEMALGVPA